MFAKNLEILLMILCEKGDVSTAAPDDYAKRFELLRNYGQLPRGREKRNKILTTSEIAGAILGLVTNFPAWAGHAAVILSKLRLANEPDASFFGTATLKDSIAHILADEIVRKAVTRLEVSLAEGATNSHGYATLFYQIAGAKHRAVYVPNGAKPRPSADEVIEPITHFSPTCREMAFNRPFSDRRAREIEVTTLGSARPAGDGSEYDGEEARQERYRRLGVGHGSRFLNVGVDNQVTWPNIETLVKFDRYQFVLMPKTQNHVQSIHVDLTKNRLSATEAMTIINRFLSIMTWCDDQFAIAQEGWSGNPVPVAVPKRDLAFTPAPVWLFDRRLPSSEDARRALALYREARNAEQNYMVSYAVLNYYKIIEIKNHGSAAVRGWFRDNYATLARHATDNVSLRRFSAICGGEKPHEYIYKSCRIAVAHSGKYSKSDPDNSNELTRLHTASQVLRMLARQFISTELGVSDVIYSGD